jgi:hypothetical protein
LAPNQTTATVISFSKSLEIVFPECRIGLLLSLR